LEVHPKFSGRTEAARQPQRGIRSDASPLVDDLANPRWRHSKIPRDPVDAHAEISHELLAKNFTWVNRSSMRSSGHIVYSPFSGSP
jgi:hypothetical protein